MLDSSKKVLATLTAAAILGGGSWAVAAKTNSATGTTPTGAAIAQAQQGQGQAPPQHEQVTGDALAKVTSAVTAKVPGATVDRAEKDPQGYHAHITRSDGTRARVQMDADFAVTSVTADNGMRGGPRGGGDRPADVTGDTLAKITSAVTAKFAGATVDHAHKARTGSGYEAHVVKKDGSRVKVMLDESFTVTSTTADRGPGSMGGRHGGPGGPGGGPAETPLTGDQATKAKAAAEAKVPGATVDRVETDADQGAAFEAHVTKSDGSRATVLMDKDFTVTSVVDG